MSDSAPPAAGPAPLAAARLARFDALRAAYPPEATPSLVLPLLHAVQDECGFVTDDDARQIAAYLDLPPGRVIEALHWYSMFRPEPAGRHVLQVCRNIACSLRGAETLLAHLERRLGIRVGETTPDGRYTIETVECLASCGTAPALRVDGRYHECVDVAALDRLLDELP